ncbi:MAG: thiol peroxidase [Phototrophicales bacterium]|nr:MAG: thiol peroxidase [Phototrophicales bacterium]
MKVGESEHTVQYDMLKVGDKAPDFKLVANDLSIKSLADFDGKVKIISVIPSIDTGVCSAQTRRFNQEAAQLGDDIVVLTVSADMPFALKRYCGNEGVENTITLTTYRDMKFADDYGVHDIDWRVCQRAVFVVDKNNVIQHVEYVPVIGNEVDFEAALSKAKELV